MQSPLCNAAASAAVLSCTCAAAPGSQLPALQSSRIALAGIELCAMQCTPMSPNALSAMHSNRLKPASTQLRPTCITLPCITLALLSTLVHGKLH